MPSGSSSVVALIRIPLVSSPSFASVVSAVVPALDN